MNGGYIATGDLAASTEVTLKNPLRRISAAQRGEQFIAVTTELEIIPVASSLRLAVDGIRLCTLRVDREGVFQLPAPRVSGFYDVSFLSGVGSDMSLGTASVQVNVTHRCSIGFLTPSGNEGDGQVQVATTAPGSAVHVVCGGPLMRGKDVVFVHRCDDGNISAAPKPSAFQTPLKRSEVNGQSMATLEIRDEGVYHVSLALYHEAGTYLCGARALLIVSSLASSPGSIVKAMDVPTCTTPRLAAATAPSVAPTDDRVMCVVCRDHVIQIKFDPCKHVIVCEGCHEQLKRMGGRELLCPLCRAKVTSAEKVFIP